MHRLRVTNSLRDRSSLLGDYHTPPASGRSSPFNQPQSTQQPFGHKYVDDLEGQNDEHLEGLTAKVKLLKDVSECFYHLLLMRFIISLGIT